MAKLNPQDRNALLDILSRKNFARDPGILRVILTRSSLQEQVNNLDLSGFPEVVILNILEFLEQYGQDEFGSQALGRFLNTLIAGNYIGDIKEKSFINNIVKKYSLIPPTAIPLPTPDPRRSTSEETNLLNESIIGENTLRPISFLMRAIEVAGAISFVAVPSGSGTGFLVSPNLLLTNNHVIPDNLELGSCTFRFNYQLGLDGLPEKYEDYKASRDGIFHTNEKLDYSIIEIENMPGRRWGHVLIHQEIPKIRDRVNIIQHAGGEPKKISIQNNFLEYVDDIFIQYVTSTLPGSSGSPVFNDAWRAVGIHHAGGMITEPATNRKYFRNEGIRLSAVLNDLPSEIKEKLSTTEKT